MILHQNRLNYLKMLYNSIIICDNILNHFKQTLASLKIFISYSYTYKQYLI
jgi:hypothetical protein